MDEVKQSKKSILLDYLKVIVITLIVTYGGIIFCSNFKSVWNINASYIS